MTLTLQDLALIQDILLRLIAVPDRCVMLGYKPQVIQELGDNFIDQMSKIKCEIKLVVPPEPKK